jgi:hypothetical protein
MQNAVSNTNRAKVIHNAGHAVATALIENDRGREQCENPAHQLRWNVEYEVMSALGSIIAEQLVLHTVEPQGASNDIANAIRHIQSLTTDPQEQLAYVAFLSARVSHVLERHLDFIEHVAKELESSERAANEIARSAVTSFVGSR